MQENDYYQILEVCFELENMAFWRRNLGVPSVLMSCESDKSEPIDDENETLRITKEVQKQLIGMEGRLEEMERKIGGLEIKMTGVENKLDPILGLLRPSVLYQ